MNAQAGEEHDLRRFLAGDREGDRWFVDRYSGWIYRWLVHRRGAQAADAEDVTQDSLLKAMRARASFWRAEQAPTAESLPHLDRWVMTIAANAYLDLLRRATRREAAPIDEQRSAAAAPRTTAEDQLDLDSIMAELTDQDRRILILDARGHTSEEIGAAVGCTAVAVRQRKQRVLAKLRERHGKGRS